ncbi:hypothetical protein HN51_005301 [Arachis hypogaea]
MKPSRNFHRACCGLNGSVYKRSLTRRFPQLTAIHRSTAYWTARIEVEAQAIKDQDSSSPSRPNKPRYGLSPLDGESIRRTLFVKIILQEFMFVLYTHSD